MLSVQRDLKDTWESLLRTVDLLLHRGEELSNLHKQSEQLVHQSKRFSSGVLSLRSKRWLYCVILLILVVLTTAYGLELLPWPAERSRDDPSGHAEAQ